MLAIVERPGATVPIRALTRALARLGPAYIKLGQFLATRPDIVGVGRARDLESLQDRLPPFPQEEASRNAVIAASARKAVTQVSASFGPPVAAASIAQVHRAEIDEDGVRKSRSQGAEAQRRAALSPRPLGLLFAAQQGRSASGTNRRRCDLVEVVTPCSRSVAMEMDLRLEAAALSEMAQNARDDPDFRVPDVDWDRTATSEY